MAEGFKSLSAVIGPHATVADTPEGKGGIRKVHDDIVYATTAKADRGEDGFLVLLVIGEEIQSQRMFPLLYKAKGLFKGIIGDDGKNGTENFFLHQCRVKLRFGDDGRCDAPRSWINLSAPCKRSALEKADEPGKVFFIDDVSKVACVQRV